MSTNPFHDHNLSGTLPFEKFGGRTELIKELETLTWGRNPQRETFLWVVEGVRGYGKSSFADWCLEASRRKLEGNQVLVCKLDFVNDFPRGKELTAVTAIATCLSIIEKEIINRKSGIARRFQQVKTAIGNRSVSVEHELLKVEDLRPEDLNTTFTVFFESVIKKAAAEPSIKTVLFVFDEVSTRTHETGNDAGEDSSVSVFCSDFSSRLRQHPFPDSAPNIGAILLCLPGHVRSTNHRNSPLRHASRPLIALQPFERGELRHWIGDLVEGANCKTSDDFIDELYRYSGGIPDLVQAYGTGAWKAACKRDDRNVCLTGADVHPNGRLAHPLIDNKSEAIRANCLGDQYAKLNASEFRMLRELGRIETKTPSNMTLDRWVEFALQRLQQVDRNRAAAQRVLDVLLQSGIIIPENQSGATGTKIQYSFRSEGVRLSLSR